MDAYSDHRPVRKTPDVRDVRQRQDVAELPVAVQLVGGARRGDRRHAVVVLLVVVPHRVDLVVDRPAVAQIRLDADVLEVRRDAVEVELVVQRRGRIAGHQEVVAELLDLRAGRALLVRRVAVQMHHRAERREHSVVAQRVLILRRKRVPILEVERLVAVRLHVVAFDQQARFPVRAELARIELHVEQARVERAVRRRPADQLAPSAAIGRACSPIRRRWTARSTPPIQGCDRTRSSRSSARERTPTSDASDRWCR